MAEREYYLRAARRRVGWWAVLEPMELRPFSWEVEIDGVKTEHTGESWVVSWSGERGDVWRPTRAWAIAAAKRQVCRERKRAERRYERARWRARNNINTTLEGDPCE